jgi:hypothetical protein
MKITAFWGVTSAVLQKQQVPIYLPDYPTKHARWQSLYSSTEPSNLTRTWSRIGFMNVWFEVSTAMFMKSSVLWDITPCNPLKVNRRFGETCRYHLRTWRISQRKNQRERKWQAEPPRAGFYVDFFFNQEIGTSDIDWAQLRRLLREDGDRIQSPKRCVLIKKQPNNRLNIPSSKNFRPYYTTRRYIPEDRSLQILWRFLLQGKIMYLKMTKHFHFKYE